MKKTTWISLMFLCCTFYAVQSKESKNILLGKAISINMEVEQGLELKTGHASVFVKFYSPNVVRIRIDNQKFGRDFSYAVVGKPIKTLVKKIQEKDKIILMSDSLRLDIKTNPVRFEFYTTDGKIINKDNDGFGTMWSGDEVTTYKEMMEGERFVGLGEKTGPLDRRGQSYVHWNTDAFAYGTWQDPIYASFPFYIGIHSGLNYGIFFDNTYESEFNFGASNNRFSSFGARGGEMDYYFIYHTKVADIVHSYTYLTGKPPLPPMWSLGYNQNRYSYYPEKEVLRIARTLREKEIPADGITLDIHYMDKYKVFTWDKKRFPDPKKLNKTLEDMGFKTTVIVNPGVKVLEGYDPYDDGVKEDIFIKYPDGKYYTGEVWPGWCHFTDYTTEKGRTWWKKHMKKQVDSGITGFWTDMNEIATWGQRMPANVEFGFDGETATHRKARNVYGLLMSKATYEGGLELMGGNRPFLLTRAAFSGSQRYTALWTGDNRSEADHMIAGVRLLNSLGLTGMSFVGMDTGGFTGRTTVELFNRWIQIGAFNPYFRNHKQVNNQSSEPWTFGEEVTEISRNYIKLRYRLLPYIYSGMYEATQTGMPLQRSLAFDYTHDGRTYGWPYQNQYLFGHAFLVVPVEPYKQFEKIFLPKGKWYDLYSGKVEQGDTEKIIELNTHKLPIYVKESSIIPMQSQIYFVKEKTDGIMYLHIYKGSVDNTYRYYEDDGQTFAYQKGAFYKRDISYTPSKNEINLKKVEGNYTSKFNKIKFVLHGFDDLEQVEIAGKRLAVKDELLNYVEPVSKFDPTGGSFASDDAKVKVFTIEHSDDIVEVKW